MWIGEQIVEASGGEFIKWTGDGFLAWYSCELERNKGLEAAAIFDAAWHLSFTNNITNFDVNTENKFQLRHGVAWEPDALIMNIKHSNNKKSKDLLGRNIVFAFRISGISVDFPHIVTQSSLSKSSKNKSSINHHFEKIELDDNEILKYFKGEKQGIRYLVGSSSIRKQNTPSKRPITKQIDRTIKKDNNNKIKTQRYLNTIEEYRKRMLDGPDWANNIIKNEEKFIKDEMLNTIKITYKNLLNFKGKNIEKEYNEEFLNYLSKLRNIIEENDYVK